MAVPTLETNGDADVLRITDGTSGDPVTWDDVWNWGAGSGAGLVPKDGGGDARVDTFMTEITADAIYTIEKKVQFGNSSDATYFQSANESVDLAELPNCVALATCVIGKASNTEYSKNGSRWSFPGAGFSAQFPTTGDLEIYGSQIRITGNYWSLCPDVSGGAVKIRQSIFDITNQTVTVRAGCSDLDVDGLYVADALTIRVVPSYFDNVHVEALYSPGFAITAVGGAVITVPNLNITNPASPDIYVSNAKMVLVNPKFTIINPRNVSAPDTITHQVTCNIHVADKDGTNLEGVAVLCEDNTETEVFDELTDANGDIAEQVITYKKWTTTAETLTEYTPHTFTITKAGYEPLILEGISADQPLVLHFEAQDPIDVSGPLFFLRRRYNYSEQG